MNPDYTELRLPESRKSLDSRQDWVEFPELGFLWVLFIPYQGMVVSFNNSFSASSAIKRLANGVVFEHPYGNIRLMADTKVGSSNIPANHF